MIWNDNIQRCLEGGQNKIMKELKNIIIYKSADGQTKIDVPFDSETVWLSEKQMAELFDTTKQNISLNLKNIFDANELKEKSVVKEYLTTSSDGKKYETQCYNLDAIISIGYRVNSVRGTQFRIWATQKLREYMVKGFVLDDERLKNGSRFGKDYFDHLFQRIRLLPNFLGK